MARLAAPSRTTAAGDGFLFPRGWEESEAEAQAAETRKATAARGVTPGRRAALTRLRRRSWKPPGCRARRSASTAAAGRCGASAAGRQALTRRWQEAGYHPDLTQGLRRLGGPVEDGEEPEAVPVAVAPGAAPEKRYGSVLTESCSGHDGAAAPPPPRSIPVAVLLRRIFPTEHPGVAAMTGWLEEEEVGTATQLRALLESGGAAALQRLGFRADWAEACASGFKRAAAAAARECE